MTNKQRNCQCPCRSGLKWKKCCGSGANLSAEFRRKKAERLEARKEEIRQRDIRREQERKKLVEDMERHTPHNRIGTIGRGGTAGTIAALMAVSAIGISPGIASLLPDDE